MREGEGETTSATNNTTKVEQQPGMFPAKQQNDRASKGSTSSNGSSSSNSNSQQTAEAQAKEK